MPHNHPPSPWLPSTFRESSTFGNRLRLELYQKTKKRRDFFRNLRLVPLRRGLSSPVHPLPPKLDGTRSSVVWLARSPTPLLAVVGRVHRPPPAVNDRTKCNLRWQGCHPDWSRTRHKFRARNDSLNRVRIWWPNPCHDPIYYNPSNFHNLWYFLQQNVPFFKCIKLFFNSYLSINLSIIYI